MKKNSSSFIWGGLLILIGLLLAGRAVDLFTFNIFFDGWWSMFIIIPCFIGLFNTGGDKSSYLIGLCIGVFLLLSAQDIVRWSMFGPLCLAAILVVVGFSMIRPKGKNDKYSSDNKYKTYQNTTYQNSANQGENSQSATYTYEESFGASGSDSNSQVGSNSQAGSYNQTGSNFQTGSNNQTGSNSQTGSSGYQDTYQNARQGGRFACTAVLSGRELRFDNEVFQGAMLSAVLGGIEIDLRNAIIRENVVIEAKAILGGIDIFVPNYVRVVINCTPILGGVDNKTITPLGANEQTITIYLNATCVLGGIDVK